LAAQVAASQKEQAQKTEFKAKQSGSQAAMNGELQEHRSSKSPWQRARHSVRRRSLTSKRPRRAHPLAVALQLPQVRQ